MSTGIWARLDELFHRGMHHPNVVKRREIAMSAYTHLKACVDAGNAKIADLEKQNADLQSQLSAAHAAPAGTADTDLESLASSIESVLGTQIADPDPAPQPTATDPATGLPAAA